MVDHHTVCCMCGDIGFPDKLFRCTKCRHRFQHSYCSNYYGESSQQIGLCDWCQSEDRSSTSSRNDSSSRKLLVNDGGATGRSEYSGDKIKQQHDPVDAADKGKNPAGAPSPRPTPRRYKLLKDVMY
ncbi:uncharacterized protein LOC127787098 [Diospyros lotus]|uniref:uncharacterized protein LOC127787098 n=1 Tax=Diospyros lotus TaxID=55363 RepID=UPI002254C607|nr:uncharacterized protein LOC127787098 [Diospyros lotus]